MNTNSVSKINLKIVNSYQVGKLFVVAKILYKCGKDMAKKYDLHHWDNPFIKSLLIVLLCSLRKDIYLVYLFNSPVATFMTKIDDDELFFEKLATHPKDSGRGIGSYCLDFIEDIARENNCEKVRMEVYEPSSHAINFYLNRGYTVAGTKETLKYHELIMEKVV